MTERYADLYESLTKEALSFAERLFAELEIPPTDVEDVAAEAALAVILANRRGAFKSARNAAERKRLQLARLQDLVRNAARDRRDQKLAVSLSALDEEPADETAAALAAELARATSDGGTGAETIRSDGPGWLARFKSAEDGLRRDDKRPRKKNLTAAERKAAAKALQDKRDERNEYRRIKRSVDIPAAPPKDIPHVRRVRARAGLRRRFTPPYEAYHRELEAAKRRNRH